MPHPIRYRTFSAPVASSFPPLVPPSPPTSQSLFFLELDPRQHETAWTINHNGDHFLNLDHITLTTYKVFPSQQAFGRDELAKALIDAGAYARQAIRCFQSSSENIAGCRFGIAYLAVDERVPDGVEGRGEGVHGARTSMGIGFTSCWHRGARLFRAIAETLAAAAT
ncbi:hypothetical protein BJ508DRAFT_304882 [Ascobolus immersus RN42]|uniref:Uncharacterized protein n=1 Tax=Ascobolus immersus RN42 TaxID=1160509 RepID=A0A3N4IAN1_ASCIM|nr:hypothetical protein BJ508DRAFT_304882 [Ascobolus immersus RN42]